MWMLMKISVGSLKRIKGGVAKKTIFAQMYCKNQIETEYKY